MEMSSQLFKWTTREYFGVNLFIVHLYLLFRRIRATKGTYSHCSWIHKGTCFNLIYDQEHDCKL